MPEWPYSRRQRQQQSVGLRPELWLDVEVMLESEFVGEELVL
jgi:hypothetical protein